ncbi:MAG: deoxyribonuclease IV [Endomicrobia bacterium]|nr:deoxyribonuclease IV [Endomicrobiia bacterium]
MIRFGIHASLRNGLDNAIEQALAAGCEAMQIFTKSPRIWNSAVYSRKDIASFQHKLKTSKLSPFIIHTFYLQNLATSNEELYKKSFEAFEKDLLLASEIGAKYYVIHPGSYSETAVLDEGIERIAKSINAIYSKNEIKTTLLLENLAGEGRKIGSNFKELAQIIEKINNKSKIAVCFDTAHAFGAGYDLSNPKKIDMLLKDFDVALGLDKLKVIHFNDSKMPLASKKDRHEHLGNGMIGAKGLEYFVKSVKDIAEAGIIETPKEPEGSDIINLKKLFKWRGK